MLDQPWNDMQMIVWTPLLWSRHLRVLLQPVALSHSIKQFVRIANSVLCMTNHDNIGEERLPFEALPAP